MPRAWTKILSVGLSVALSSAAAVVTGGCGGYASRSEAFRRSMMKGQTEQALARVNKELKVRKAEDLPRKSDADTPLLLLERATILQALGRHKLSARDYQTADGKLEVLDLTSNTAGEIGKFIYSGDSTTYRAAPHEKLLLNTLNLVNYLALGDLSGAKVEARRFTINRKYLEGAQAGRKSMLALGSYLAGFVFEKDGELGSAMRYYGEAHGAGGLPTLVDAARRLAVRTGDVDDRLRDAVGEIPSGDEATAAIESADSMSDVLIVLQVGIAPYKEAVRLPIGAAVVAASNPGPGARLSSADRRRANLFAAKGLLKWVNYPKLRRVRTARGRTGRIDVTVDGRSAAGGIALDVEERVIEEFETHEGALLATAIVRLITRAAAGEISQRAAKKATKSGLAGLLIGLAVEGALTAADTPDTRSWVTLPARIYVARAQVKPGRHRINIRTFGVRQSAEIDVPAGGWAVVSISSPR